METNGFAALIDELTQTAYELVAEAERLQEAADELMAEAERLRAYSPRIQDQRRSRDLRLCPRRFGSTAHHPVAIARSHPRQCFLRSCANSFRSCLTRARMFVTSMVSRRISDSRRSISRRSFTTRDLFNLLIALSVNRRSLTNPAGLRCSRADTSGTGKEQTSSG
jgi:hypothetical protein